MDAMELQETAPAGMTQEANQATGIAIARVQILEMAVRFYITGVVERMLGILAVLEARGSVPVKALTIIVTELLMMGMVARSTTVGVAQ